MDESISRSKGGEGEFRLEKEIDIEGKEVLEERRPGVVIGR